MGIAPFFIRPVDGKRCGSLCCGFKAYHQRTPYHQQRVSHKCHLESLILGARDAALLQLQRELPTRLALPHYATSTAEADLCIFGAGMTKTISKLSVTSPSSSCTASDPGKTSTQRASRRSCYAWARWSQANHPAISSTTLLLNLPNTLVTSATLRSTRTPTMNC